MKLTCVKNIFQISCQQRGLGYDGVPSWLEREAKGLRGESPSLLSSEGEEKGETTEGRAGITHTAIRADPAPSLLGLTKANAPSMCTSA